MIVDYTFIHGYSGRKMKRILIMVIKYIEGHHYNDVDGEMVKENAGGVFVCLPTLLYFSIHTCVTFRHILFY